MVSLPDDNIYPLVQLLSLVVGPAQMSTKSKLFKFRNAVAASSSSSASSTSRFVTLTIPEANTLQALHQEQLARIAAATLPNLAAMHSRQFLNMARTQLHSGDAMWATQKASSVAYRRSIWAEDIEPDTTPINADATSRIVPDFYHKHNSRCPRCALPLIPGLNQLSLPPNTKKSTSKITKQRPRSKARKRTSHCTLCLHKTRF